MGLYTELLRNWTVTYYTTAPETQEDTTALRTFVQHVGDVCLNLLQVRFPPPCPIVCMEACAYLATVTQASDGASVIADSILSFYECASTLPWENRLFRIVLPADPLVYHFVFVGDAAMVSRICGILSG